MESKRCMLCNEVITTGYNGFCNPKCEKCYNILMTALEKPVKSKKKTFKVPIARCSQCGELIYTRDTTVCKVCKEISSIEDDVV